MKSEISPKLLLSWALYDLANQFFALNIVSLYFPLWLKGKGCPEILYSISFGISMLFVAISAPILGIISDMRKRHKAFLVYFTYLSIIFTMAMGLSTNLFLALTLFAIANFGCQEAIIFYNSLLVKVAPKDKIGFVSGLGRMFGYTGAILALYLTTSLAIKMGYQVVFFLTGILFLIFSLPCMIFIKGETPEERASPSYFLEKERLLQISRRLKTAIFDSYRFPGLKNFLKASFFGLCVVNTIILFMSIYCAKVFNLTTTEMTNLVIFSTVFAIASSIVSGFISDIIGYGRSLIGVFLLWAICLLGGGLLDRPFHWLIGALVGISLGATWVIARALVIKLVPKERLGEAFGLFNLVSYISGIVGPIFWGLILLYLSRFGRVGYRLAFLSFILFIALGIIYLLRMRKEGINYGRAG